MSHLHRRIEQYLSRSGTSPTRFGRQAARDPQLVLDMRRGREVGPSLGARLSAYLAEAEARLEGSSCSR